MAGGAAEGLATAGGTAAGGAALEPSAGGGEERRTQGRKVLPSRIFAIPTLEKEKKGVGWGGGGVSEIGNGK